VAFTPDDQQLVAGLHSREETAVGVANNSIHAWPTQIPKMSSELCKLVTRNLTKDEWTLYMRGLDYESTCSNLPSNNK
jgi:hypothetical protein